ncbi:2'-5' RNA ligase family protein [Streptomyces sp. Tu 3180]|uniref:2'-5' RNA ligase family protein n=1 Tax=Streptomyces sp. Tu 3180 TaxID=2682611 RepID=UPI001FB709D2|nr:2'-5' RNA ligase family protein [Streptomyces sp. Tu 3180]
MRTVELLPDAATELRVREVWRRMADAGLPSLAEHRHPTNRPHVTLATCEDIPPSTKAELAAVLGNGLPAPFRLDGLLHFAGRTRVLAWRVVADAELTELHRRVWDVLAPTAGHLNPLHAPERWIPHLTLARSRRTPAQWPAPLLPAALRGPWEATFTGARSYDSTTRTVESLGGEARPPAG